MFGGKRFCPARVRHVQRSNIADLPEHGVVFHLGNATFGGDGKIQLCPAEPSGISLPDAFSARDPD